MFWREFVVFNLICGAFMFWFWVFIEICKMVAK